MIVNLLFAGSQLVMVVAGDVPNLNVEPGCRSAINASVAVQRTFNDCMNDENAARDKLSGDWARFSAGDKDRCQRMVTVGGQVSYVELLSCLELGHDAAELQQRGGDALAPAAATGGRAPTSGTLPLTTAPKQ